MVDQEVILHTCILNKKIARLVHRSICTLVSYRNRLFNYMYGVRAKMEIYQNRSLGRIWFNQSVMT